VTNLLWELRMLLLNAGEEGLQPSKGWRCFVSDKEAGLGTFTIKWYHY
jgi:hypothetical protein